MTEELKLQARITVMLNDHKPEDIINEIRRQTASTSQERISGLKQTEKEEDL